MSKPVDKGQALPHWSLSNQIRRRQVMSAREHRLRRRSRRPVRLLARLAQRVRSARRRDGAGVAVWVVIAIGAIGAGGLAAAGRTGAPLPSGAIDGPALASALREVGRRSVAAPADAAPHLERAYLEALRPGPLDAAALGALRRSYALEPLGPDASAWRLRFIFDHWPAIPADLRRQARAELAAAFPRHGWALRELPQSVSEPTGRMVAVLMFEQLRMAQTREQSPYADAVQ